MKHNPQEEKIKTWVEHVVVGLDLCPFAREPFKANLLRFKELPDDTDEMDFFMDELLYIQNEKPHKLSSSLLIYPGRFPDFQDFLDFVGGGEEIIKKVGLDSLFQTVPFHPEFQFQDAEYNDRSNYVNRSPFPLIHVLRADEVELATTDTEIGENTSLRNAQLLREMNDDDFNRKVLNYL